MLRNMMQNSPNTPIPASRAGIAKEVYSAISNFDPVIEMKDIRHTSVRMIMTKAGIDIFDT
jgi:hypothetical protein